MGGRGLAGGSREFSALESVAGVGAPLKGLWCPLEGPLVTGSRVDPCPSSAHGSTCDPPQLTPALEDALSLLNAFTLSPGKGPGTRELRFYGERASRVSVLLLTAIRDEYLKSCLRRSLIVPKCPLITEINLPFTL